MANYVPNQILPFPIKGLLVTEEVEEKNKEEDLQDLNFLVFFKGLSVTDFFRLIGLGLFVKAKTKRLDFQEKRIFIEEIIPSFQKGKRQNFMAMSYLFSI